MQACAKSMLHHSFRCVVGRPPQTTSAGELKPRIIPDAEAFFATDAVDTLEFDVPFLELQQHRAPASPVAQATDSDFPAVVPATRSCESLGVLNRSELRFSPHSIET